MTAEELQNVWSERDQRYGASRNELNDDAIIAVRDWRRREAADIDNDIQRSNAYNEAALWLPPVRLR